jgi:carotenoid cleavage dioxygenase-like enzyme
MSTQPQTDETDNYFLSGNYAPVREEHVATDLKVIGELPADLNGYFLRIGPNPVFVPDVAAYHIFDGDGMIHQVEFKAGVATYRNRFVESAGFLKEREKGDWIWKGMVQTMEDMAAGNPLPEGGQMKDLVNTAMVFHANTFYGLMEGGTPHEIRLPELDTVARVDFDGKLKHGFTAHPKVDVETGEMMTFGYSPVPPFVSYSVINKDSELVHTTPITIPKGVMMHDCAITERFTIFLDLPITFDFERAMKGESMLDWEPENGSRIGVVPRLGSDEDVQWFEIENCMMFHVANAWEEGDEIVLLGCRANRTDVANATDTMADESADMRDQLALLTEWRLDRSTGKSTERNINPDLYCEFPRINDDLAGRPSRFVYLAGIDADLRGTPMTSVIKYDRANGSMTVHPLGEGGRGGEAVFAPRANASSEDDGYVIVFRWDEIREVSECIVLDAQNFAAEPVARIQIPYRVPFGFHADWVPNAG